MKNFLIWWRVVKGNINLKSMIYIFIEHLVLYLLIYFLTKYNFVLSFILLLLLMVIRSAIRLFVFYKKLNESNNFEQILLKPIDPLLGLIVYQRSISDIVVLLPFLVFINFKNKKQI